MTNQIDFEAFVHKYGDGSAAMERLLFVARALIIGLFSSHSANISENRELNGILDQTFEAFEWICNLAEDGLKAQGFSIAAGNLDTLDRAVVMAREISSLLSTSLNAPVSVSDSKVREIYEKLRSLIRTRLKSAVKNVKMYNSERRDIYSTSLRHAQAQMIHESMMMEIKKAVEFELLCGNCDKVLSLTSNLIQSLRPMSGIPDFVDSLPELRIVRNDVFQHASNIQIRAFKQLMEAYIFRCEANISTLIKCSSDSISLNLSTNFEGATKSDGHSSEALAEKLDMISSQLTKNVSMLSLYVYLSASQSKRRQSSTSAGDTGGRGSFSAETAFISADWLQSVDVFGRVVRSLAFILGGQYENVAESLSKNLFYQINDDTGANISQPQHIDLFALPGSSIVPSLELKPGIDIFSGFYVKKSDLYLYAVLCALATMPRNQIKEMFVPTSQSKGEEAIRDKKEHTGLEWLLLGRDGSVEEDVEDLTVMSSTSSTPSEFSAGRPADIVKIFLSGRWDELLIVLGNTYEKLKKDIVLGSKNLSPHMDPVMAGDSNVKRSAPLLLHIESLMGLIYKRILSQFCAAYRDISLPVMFSKLKPPENLAPALEHLNVNGPHRLLTKFLSDQAESKEQKLFFEIIGQLICMESPLLKSNGVMNSSTAIFNIEIDKDENTHSYRSQKNLSAVTGILGKIDLDSMCIHSNDVESDRDKIIEKVSQTGKSFMRGAKITAARANAIRRGKILDEDMSHP